MQVRLCAWGGGVRVTREKAREGERLQREQREAEALAQRWRPLYSRALRRAPDAEYTTLAEESSRVQSAVGEAQGTPRPGWTGSNSPPASPPRTSRCEQRQHSVTHTLRLASFVSMATCRKHHPLNFAQLIALVLVLVLVLKALPLVISWEAILVHVIQLPRAPRTSERQQ